MISDSGTQACANLLKDLVEPAIRSLVIAGLAALVLLLARVRKPALRLAIWTSVLYAALAMPFLGVLMPAVTLPLPAPFVGRLAPPAPGSGATHLMGATAANSALEARIGSSPVSSQAPAEVANIPWAEVALGFYALGACLGLTQLGLGWLLTSRLRRAARTIKDPRAQALFAGLILASGVKRRPLLAESEAVVVPVTVGHWTPMILLSVGWLDWSEARLRAVLTHELSHVARRDFLTQTLAALHRCFFWFSPLGWWLERHIADLAEQSSDDATLASGAEASDYAEALVSFLGARDRAHGRVRWWGVAMARCEKARQRLDHILSRNHTVSARLSRPAQFAVVVCAVPLTCVVAAMRPSIHSRYALAPTETARNTSQEVPASASKAKPAVPQAQSPDSHRPSQAGADSYIFVCCGGESYMSNTDNRQQERVKALRAKLGTDIIWMRRKGKSYIIRDDAIVREARELWTNYEVQVAQIRTRLAELGVEQAGLGVAHAELGVRRTELRKEAPDLADQLRKVEVQIQQLHEGSSPEQFNQAQAELNLLQARVRELQAKSESQQAGEAQKVSLYEENARLEVQQRTLMEQQKALVDGAFQRMTQLIDDAFSRGLAQPE